MPDRRQTFDELITDDRAALKECHTRFENIKKSERELWKRWAGSRLEEMLMNRNAAETFLKESNANLRLAALAVLAFHWGPSKDLGPICEQMALNDPDVEVRASSLVVLGVCFAGTNDAKIGKLLANIVRDETKPAGFRSKAYVNLFQIRGLPVESWPPFDNSFAFPRDVDWSFVESFENGEEKVEVNKLTP